MFPVLEAEVKEQLQHSMRFYPWLNNSGGFYVCLLEKTAELDFDDLSELIANQAMNYEKLNEKTDFDMNFSKKLPLHPQKKIEN